MHELEKRIESLFNEINEQGNEFLENLENIDIDLTSNEISKAILYRLRTYYIYQDGIKNMLNKRVAAQAADFFVETVAFYLKAVLKKFDSDLEVHSERLIVRGNLKIRPDISVFRNEEMVAFIECKTQLGWDRHGWETNFISRTANVHHELPNVRSYLAVMTSQNWGGFGDNPLIGTQYFVLSKEWPSVIDTNNMSHNIINSFEILFASILDI